MRMWRTCRVIAAVVIGLAMSGNNPAWAQVGSVSTASAMAESGLLPVQRFTPAEYGAGAQNWSITQGPAGIIYVGNANGQILVHDGTRWQQITVPSGSTVRSLATGPDGRIYVGLVGDFGYLAANAEGNLGYVSLASQLSKTDRNFTDVWSIHVTPEGICFSTYRGLYFLHQGALRVVRPQTSFHTSFVVDGKLYVREVDRGLLQVAGHRLKMLPGGAFFADKRVYALLPWKVPGAQPGELLVGTRAHGWFLLHDGHVRRWQVDDRQALDRADIYGAIWLPGDLLAVATVRDGLYVLDRQGRIVRHLTRNNGLTSNVILYMYLDHQQGLWLATGSGVARVEVTSPLTHFSERSGLYGTVLAIKRFHGTLYVGTTEGLYRLVTSSDGHAHFEKNPHALGQNWSLVPFGDQLLLAGNEGVFTVPAQGHVRNLLKTPRTRHVSSAQALLRSQRDPSRVFVAYQNGLGSVRWDGRRWIDEGRLPGIGKEVRTLAQDVQGHVWLAYWGGGMGRLTLPSRWRGPDDPRPTRLQTFDQDDGLPGGQVSVAKVNGQVVFLTSEGICRFDAGSEQFALDPAFQELFSTDKWRVRLLYQGRRDVLWLYATTGNGDGKRTGRAKLEHGRWHWLPTPFQPLNGIGIFSFYADADGATWLGGDRRLYRYQPSAKALPQVAFHALVRQLAVQGGKVYSPAGLHGVEPRIPYTRNSVRLHFAAPSFGSAGAHQFQVQLQGMSKAWSPWSKAVYRDYTSLHEGEYVFRVRARNVFGQSSDVASFRFRILPPWYRSGWAWTLWILSGVLVLCLFAYLSSLATRRRNRLLEQLVEQRTGELARANQALQDSNTALAEQIVTDPLTGMRNRRYFTEHIGQDMATVSRRGQDFRRTGRRFAEAGYLLFLMIDIDHFKHTNDTYGHAAGDKVLQQFAEVMRVVVRDMDMAVRWGGEEFLVVARFVAAEDGPLFAERIRAAVAGYQFDLGNGQHIKHTCSVGFAPCPTFLSSPEQLDWEDIVDLADACLYAAKQHGRNAWAGIMPMVKVPQGKPMDLLGAALDSLPRRSPLRVEASWVQADPNPPVAGV